METTVFQRIKMIRNRVFETQSQMAEKLGVTSQYVSQLESGKANVGLALAEKISELYQVPIEWVLHGKGNIEQSESTPWKDEAYRKLEQENERLWNLVEMIVGKGAAAAIAKLLGNRNTRDAEINLEGRLKAA